MERSEIKTAFRDALLDQIRQDRDEVSLNRDLIKDAIEIYIDLSRVGDPHPVRVDSPSAKLA